ncbi:hypothetical protein DL89DRAFT_303379 [Linderina pennispora]|uniref:F-box domain-containing protein n=1 Tax=Linderina pennispora TaxID=61395 RepID=A0A1Y1VSI8_9FUNG|nr:uncharacterized protein DL89DRAFT_303379 [Linderina pennispora]ORX64237.1 hypothetical protein DL89DRAFT_303379 [Linderina pennispora]
MWTMMDTCEKCDLAVIIARSCISSLLLFSTSFFTLMTNWATLRPFILLRIANICRSSIRLGSSDNFDIYTPFLQLNQVCQHWRDTIKESLYTTAIILCCKPTAEQLFLYGGTSDSDQLASRGIHLATSSPHPILWRTNISNIVRSKNSNYTQQLLISFQDCTIDFPSLGDILEIFGFSTVEWLRLEAIRLIEDPQVAKQDSDTKLPIADDVSKRLSQTSQYFIQHLSHVKHLIHGAFSYPLKNSPAFPLGDMLDFYLPQLQTLLLPEFTLPQLDHTYFSSFLTILHLHINSESAEHIPRVFAPSLVTLWLYYSDIAHSWHIFRGSLPGSVIFENLTKLEIYHYSRISESTDESDTYLPSISFPKLKDLRLQYYPFKDSNTLALFKDAPIQTATIVDMVDRFQLSVITTFRDVQTLCISIRIWNTSVHDETTVSIAKDLFSKPFSTSIAEIFILTSLPIPVPDTILWTKLEKLCLNFPVYLFDLIHILPQLPHLCWLLVGAIYNTGNRIENTELAPIWSSTLTQLILFSSITHIPTIPSLKAMCILVSGLPFLLKLAVPDDMLSTAKGALSEHTISREFSKEALQVVGYLPDRTALYLRDGIPYTDNQGNRIA